MMNAIQFQQVEKHFGPKPALQGVTFNVKEGEIFGFLGPNGAGKSTTIRCLMDFIRADQGAVSVLGRDSHEAAAELKRDIGYLPADSYFYDHWSGHDHMQFLAGLKGAPLDRRLIERLELDDTAKVKHLSTGNKQKLGIVLALLGSPKLLVLDEPTRGLDPLLQNLFYEIILEYRAAGGTVFMSSHNLSEVDKVCDSIALIRDGKLAVEETLEDIKRQNIHRIEVGFRRPIGHKQFDMAGVEVIGHTKTALSLRITGDINPVMRIITGHELTSLEVTGATLDEIFMEQYR